MAVQVKLVVSRLMVYVQSRHQYKCQLTAVSPVANTMSKLSVDPYLLYLSCLYFSIHCRHYNILQLTFQNQYYTYPPYQPLNVLDISSYWSSSYGEEYFVISKSCNRFFKIFRTLVYNLTSKKIPRFSLPMSMVRSISFQYIQPCWSCCLFLVF